MQDTEKNIRIAITHGDINGVGYELMLRTFEDAEILELFTPIVYGSEKAWAYYSNMLGVKVACNVIRDARDARDGQVNLITAVQGGARVDMGKHSDESDNASRQALDRAMKDYEEGLFDALVMAPASNNELTAEGKIAVAVNNCVHFASATDGLNAGKAAEAISVDKVVERAKALFSVLKRDLRENNPRIAVMALNNEIATDENSAEMSIIAPAISTLVNSGVQAFGPYTGKDLMENFAYTHFDGILGMYEDQCRTISQQLFDDSGFVLISGMDIVVTSPVHSPLYDICGQGMADVTSFRNAIFGAIDVLRNRENYDIPLANPLQKIYHERREDGEKVRFSVKKKELETKQEGVENK